VAAALDGKQAAFRECIGQRNRVLKTHELITSGVDNERRHSQRGQRVGGHFVVITHLGERLLQECRRCRRSLGNEAVQLSLLNSTFRIFDGIESST